MKLGAVILTGDFNKGAERKAAANGPHGPTEDLST